MKTNLALRLGAAQIRRALEVRTDLPELYERVKAALCRDYLFSMEIQRDEWGFSLKEKHWPKPDCLTVQLRRRARRTEPAMMALLAEAMDTMADLKESRGRMAVDRAFSTTGA